MRMKIRKIGHAEPNLDGSPFQKPSVTENLTGQCNLVQNTSTVKPKLDKNISDEENEIQEDFEKKCICPRPLKKVPEQTQQLFHGKIEDGVCCSPCRPLSSGHGSVRQLCESGMTQEQA